MSIYIQLHKEKQTE